MVLGARTTPPTHVAEDRAARTRRRPHDYSIASCFLPEITIVGEEPTQRLTPSPARSLPNMRRDRRISDLSSDARAGRVAEGGLAADARAARRPPITIDEGCMTAKQIVGALAAVMLILPSQGLAEQGATKIHVVFQNYYERVRPGYAAGTTTEDMTVILSGKNSVQEIYNARNPLGSQSWNWGHVLGSGQWRVAGPNKLVKTVRRSQSVRTDVIEVHGSTCTATARFELLPGFSEYEIYSIGLHAPAFFRQARMESSTCEIKND